jgi:arylsulfatase A-like enzyme
MLNTKIFKKIILFFFVLIVLVIFGFNILKSKFICSQRKLNIILITMDALRPDHLGCYGYKRNTSPNIDRLAREGALFTPAIAQGSSTYLSLPSLHTSRYPRTHGVYNAGYKINPSLSTLAEILKKNGYSTVAICANVKHIQGLERGFDTFIDKGDIGAFEMTKIATSWLEKNRKNKFFLWVHYFEPHGPYRSPEPYNRAFLDNSEAKNISINKDNKSGLMAIPNYIAENNIMDVNYYISQYDGEIRYADEQIGILWKKIEELNLDKDLIFIFTADHGEAMGERGHYFEHWSIYDEIIKVPLLIKCKKIMPCSRNISHQVQLVDIAPTILAGVALAKPKDMQGNSLFPLILGRKNHPSFFAFSEVTQSDDTVEDCVRTKEWKLIHKRFKKRDLIDRYELYNLSIDPEEKNNLANVKPREFKFLNNKLTVWRNRNPLSASLVADSVTARLTDETKKLLRSLGYLQ